MAKSRKDKLKQKRRWQAERGRRTPYVRPVPPDPVGDAMKALALEYGGVATDGETPTGIPIIRIQLPPGLPQEVKDECARRVRVIAREARREAREEREAFKRDNPYFAGNRPPSGGEAKS